MAIPEGMTIDNYLRQTSDQVRVTANKVEFYAADYGAFSQAGQTDVKNIVSAALNAHRAAIQDVIDLIASLP